MYKRNKCVVCGYVMIGEIVGDKTFYYCPKPGHTDIPIETICFDGKASTSLDDYDVTKFTYQDIKRSLLL